MFAVGITESQERLPTFYWLPNLHKRPYKAHFIANSSSCTSLFKVLNPCLTAIKNHWIKYCEKLYEREGINYFWSIKNSSAFINLHKRPYKAHFIANSSSCTTTSLSKVLTSCLTAIKNHWIKYCEKTYEREGINYFGSIKNSIEILNKLKAKGFQASTISKYDFSTLYTTLPYDLIKNQFVDLIENTFILEEVLYLASNKERAFFASEEHKKYNLWT